MRDNVLKQNFLCGKITLLYFISKYLKVWLKPKIDENGK